VRLPGESATELEALLMAMKNSSTAEQLNPLSQSEPLGLAVSRDTQYSNFSCATGAPRVLWTTDDIQRKVEGSKVVVFAKGTLETPLCGLSEEVVSAVDACGRPYELVDVCEERSIIPALKAYAGSRYLPLVFVNGQLVSSWETQSSMLKTGELKDQIEKAFL
jgi:monothiol glutaredoxin